VASTTDDVDRARNTGGRGCDGELAASAKGKPMRKRDHGRRSSVPSCGERTGACSVAPMSCSARSLTRTQLWSPRVAAVAGMAPLLVAFGCTSEADRQYAKCLEMEKQGRLIEAAGACTNAELDDPASSSGQKALRKRRELEKKLKKKEAELDRAMDENKQNR